MPTNRKRISRNRRASPIEPFQWAELNDLPEPDDTNPFAKLAMNENDWRALWTEHHDSILENWIKQYPGTRPSSWWKFSAPRQPLDTTQPEPRLRLGGKGTAEHDGLNYVPSYHLGIPDGFVDSATIDSYANPDGTPYQFAKKFSRSNPPRFESQAAYLRRFNLLQPGETVTAEQLLPETLPCQYWPE